MLNAWVDKSQKQYKGLQLDLLISVGQNYANSMLSLYHVCTCESQ
jgi:hypothetical protein